MAKIIKPFILASVLLLGLSIIPLNQASADTSINTTVSPGEKKKVAQEGILADFSMAGVQSSIYANGYSKAEYYTENSNGTTISKKTYYGYGEISIKFTVDANGIGQQFSVFIKNIGSAVLKFIGKLDD